MENSTAEVDDAVASFIANVNFGEFAPEVVDGSYVVAHIQEATEEIRDENDATESQSLPSRAEFSQEEDESTAKPKKQRKPRQRRTKEDGEYPDIKEWKPYINALLDDGVRGYHKAVLPKYENECPHVKDYLKPDIIIWDLQTEFPDIANGSCPENGCNEPLSLYPIAYTYMMRILYDFEKPVLLVTSMLRCKNAKEHRFLGYDPRILKQLPDPEKVPFVLFHKVGITRDLFNSIMSQVSSGVKFGQIQDLLRNNYSQSHLERKVAYDNAAIQFQQENPSAKEEPKPFPAIKVKGPRNTFIGQCFLLGFKEKEYFYKLSMSQILADEWIKLDSEFKLPTNVGTNAKGVWKKEVDHLFYCQNEVGQVLTWQLTGQNNFEEVRDMLVSVRDRHDQIGKQLKGCCTDACCDWRDQLTSIFGSEFQVKYDIEIAHCKLAEKLHEDSPFFKPCIEDFRLVFQDPVDTNKIRILHTPPPNVIAGSLEMFKEKWRKVKDENGKLVLNTSVMNFLAEIEPHILDGCYSDIPPFTNGIDRKEFQNTLRRKVNNCRLGIPVMVAIASIALHDHNSSRQEDLGRDIAPVLLVVPDEGKEAAESASSLSIGNTNLQCLTVEVNMNKALESIASSQAKAVKCEEEIDVRSLMISVDEYFTNRKSSADHDYEAKNQQNVDELIIKRAVMFLRYFECQMKFFPRSYMNEKLIPFLTCAFPLIMQEQFMEETELKKTDVDSALLRFTNLKTVWHLDNDVIVTEKINQEDQFFSALAVVLEQYLKTPANSNDSDNEIMLFQAFLKEIGFHLGIPADDIVTILKGLVKNKPDMKEDNAAENEVQKTSSNNSEKDDSSPANDHNAVEGEFEILVRDIATTLSCQISIISDLLNFPVIPVFPQRMHIWSPDLFIFCKGSNFVPVLQKGLFPNTTMLKKPAENLSKPQAVKLDGKKAKCRCGRGNNSKEVGKCYTHENSKYITRCVCFRLQEPCTEKCDCKNCKNPFGCRPLKKPAVMDVDMSPANKRRRHTHHHSSLSKGLIAENFQTGAGLEVSLGKWSLAEKFLFEALISELKTEEESLTTELVAQKFNNIVQIASNITSLQDLVGFKTPTQVNERLKEREKDVESYLQMYQKQLDLMMSRQDSLAALKESEEADSDMQEV